MIVYDEKGNKINYNRVEAQEVKLAQQFVEADDFVLELGARYGGVSITTNKKLNNKQNHYVVEPDESVWEALELNKKNNNCEFNIIKGTISKKKHKLILGVGGMNVGWGNHTKECEESEESNIPNHDIPDCPFNVLIADCEGFLETFYNENKEFFKQLRMIIFEKDYIYDCNYEYLINEFRSIGFKPVINGFHSVFTKS